MNKSAKKNSAPHPPHRPRLSRIRHRRRMRRPSQSRAHGRRHSRPPSPERRAQARYRHHSIRSVVQRSLRHHSGRLSRLDVAAGGVPACRYRRRIPYPLLPEYGRYPHPRDHRTNRWRHGLIPALLAARARSAPGYSAASQTRRLPHADRHCRYSRTESSRAYRAGRATHAAAHHPPLHLRSALQF